MKKYIIPCVFSTTIGQTAVPRIDGRCFAGVRGVVRPCALAGTANVGGDGTDTTVFALPQMQPYGMYILLPGEE